MTRNFLVGLFALLISSAIADLIIMNPEELAKEFPDVNKGQHRIPSKISNIGYGNIQKGATIVGQLMAPKRRENGQGHHNGHGCEAFNWSDFNMEGIKKSDSFFLIVQRGKCSFQKKAAMAAQFGASLLIVADWDPNKPEDKKNDDFPEESGYLSMHIPTFEISHVDAQKLRRAIHAGQTVYIKAQLDHTNVENTVEVDLWYATSLDLGLKLSQEFAAMSLNFGADHNNKPLFTPRIATFTCWDCDQEYIEENCVSNGVYCGFTPSFFQKYHLDNPDSKFKMTGRQVIIQSLREKCLFKIMSDEFNDSGDMFWTFFGYNKECFTNVEEQATSFNDCYDWSTVLINKEEYVDQLNECVNGSFERQQENYKVNKKDLLTADLSTDNSMLRADMQWSYDNRVNFHPSVTINNITYTGESLSGREMEIAICEAYREAPDECQLAYQIQLANGTRVDWENVAMPNDEDLLFEQGIEDSKKNYMEQRKLQRHHIIGLILVILLVNLVVLSVVRCRMKREMQSQMSNQVQGAVNEYFALSQSASTRETGANA